jgi:poly-gamma-glutamate synthesis protein (capsule biosynthesis protein)
VKRRASFAAAGLVGLVALAGVGSGALDPGAFLGSAAPGPSSTAPAASASPASSPGATPLPTPARTPVPIVDVAIVPVTHFRTPYEATSLAEVEAILAGTSDRYEAVELVARDMTAILGALGVEAPPVAGRLVLAADADELSADLAATRNRLGFLRADDVTPAVRALAWGDEALFGVERIDDLAAWQLTIAEPAPNGPEPPDYDPGVAWTLVAGGDIMLDRGVAQTVKINGKGVDFPFDGGTAEITSRFCCSSFGWELPRTARTGNAGAMRAYLQGADLAIANFENPAPNDFRYHTSGTVFSADPALIDGLANAGIDFVSLANNHIRDAGARGIAETIANLDARDIAHSGAGANLAAARTPALLEAGDTTVAILGYDAVASYYWATDERAGSAQMTAAALAEDVAAARSAGADVVIVFPHWGAEYRATPGAAQQRLGRAAIDAGADMVIGNHAHWAAALEVYEGKPIWYALGNFVFDQTWSEPTMEGMTLELTFDGAELVQAQMRPHIILDKAQPNFLDPAGDGQTVLRQVFGASKGLLDW